MSCSKVISQIEVLPAGELGRRRSWTDAEKVRIVEESYRGHRQGSAVARKYGIARGLLTQWRRAYRKGLLEGSPVGFSPVEIAPLPRNAAVDEVGERIEITVANGRRLRVSLKIDDDSLGRLLRVLERS